VQGAQGVRAELRARFVEERQERVRGRWRGRARGTHRRGHLCVVARRRTREPSACAAIAGVARAR